ncbi:MAG: pilin [Candidatus Peregrinibacteria bacterium]
MGAPLLANGIDTIVNNAGGNSNEADSTLPTLESNQGKKAEQKTNTIIYFIINLILVIAGSIAVFLLVIGGVEYTISGGTEDRMNHAKSTITMALIGLAVIIFSYAIVGNVAKFLEAPY